jgi:hypothetical protein
LGQASAAQAKPPAPQPAANKPQAFDVSTAAAEHFEKQSETPAQDYATRALEERRKQSQLLNSQIEMLKKNLETRMNPPFDPMLMRVASGFLKPTKTGSFGESLGYAAEGAADESEKQLLRNAQVDKMKLELAEKHMGLAKQNASMENLFRLSGMPAGAPAGGAAPIGVPAGGEASLGAPTGGAPSIGASPEGGAPVAGGQAKSTTPTSGQDFRKIRQITDADIAFSYALSKEDGEIASKIAEMQRKDVMDTKYGPYSISQGKYLEVDPYVTQTTERGVPYIGKQTVTQKQSREIDQMIERSKNMTAEQAEDMFGRYYAMQGIGEVKRTKGAPAGAPSAGGAPSAPSAPAAPSAGGAPAAGGVSGMKTSAERERDKFEEQEEFKRKEAEKLERTKGDIADNKEIKSGLYASGRAANGTILTADAIYRLSTDPATKGAFGVLQDANVQSAILGAIAEGIRTPTGSFQFAGIEDAVRKIGGSDKEINAALQASRHYAELELQYARTYLKGQGAVSDNERKIVTRLGGSLSDTPSVAAAKAETIRSRADFDKRVSDLLYKWEQKNPNGYVKDFERSPEYVKLQEQFNSHMGKLNDKYFPGNATPAAPAATPMPQTNAPASAPKAQGAPAAPITVSGKEDPKYKSLNKGDLFIWNGTVYTK